MKTLIIMRHAKAEDPDGGDDFDRRLSRRGLADAPLMATLLRKIGWKPDHMVSSNAARARKTAVLVAESLGFDQPIQWERMLYGSTSDHYLQVLRILPEQCSNAVMIGHNPMIEDVAGKLCASPGSKFFLRLPTAGMVCIDFPITRWSDIDYGTGVLQWVCIPKLLRGGPKE